MVNIYFKQYSNRKKEIAFFNYLTSNIKEGVIHINYNYNLNKDLINKTLNIDNIVKKVNNYDKFTSQKKGKIINELEKLPKEILVANCIDNVSVDFVIENETSLQLIEFHEKQHKVNSDKRLKPIYGIDNKRYETPRFVQRLLKDIWRFENLENYKIVWWDWFEKNNNYIDLLNEDKKEYYLYKKFSFEELLTNTAGNNVQKQ
jgi:hypothetical protein